MRRERISCNLSLSLGLAGAGGGGVVDPLVASADEEATAHDHATHASGLQDELAGVRRVTARFHRVEQAIAAGYELGWVNGSGVRILTGCVSHPTAGAMGYHYINPQLVADNMVDALEPEALVYAPAPNGRLKLVAVEWIFRGPSTNPPGVPTAPSVLGIDMHILVPAVGFWPEHAWIWGHNPAGHVRRLESGGQLPLGARASWSGFPPAAVHMARRCHVEGAVVRCRQRDDLFGRVTRRRVAPSATRPVTGGGSAMTHHHPAARSRRLASRAVRGLAVILVVASPLWQAAPVDATSEPTSYYLSVGNSLAQGFQPIGGPHTNSAAAGYNQGYADQLFKLARDGGGDHLRLVKLGCGGESTATMIADSRCPYETGSQLGDAVEFLDDHPGEIAFITIDIGANDIFLDCGGDPSCFIQQISTNLPQILSTLREHAGPDVPIVGMNYYSPDVAQWFDDAAAGEAAAASAVAFNNFLESLYAGAGIPVADVESAFAVTDFTTLAELKGVGPVPLSVYNACTLTWICTGPPLGPDVHANNDGYGVIAEAFAAVLGV